MLPDGIPIWPDNHTATHRRIVSQFRLAYYLVIPLRKVVFLINNVFDIFSVFAHISSLRLQRHSILMFLHIYKCNKKPALLFVQDESFARGTTLIERRFQHRSTLYGHILLPTAS